MTNVIASEAKQSVRRLIDRHARQMSGGLAMTVISFFLLVGAALAAGPDKKKESYLNKTETKVQEWNTKVESLEKRSEEAGTKTRSELDRHVKTLEEKLEIVRKKLSEFQVAAKKAFNELQHAFHKTKEVP
jgi:septal ring factor EnvC (AmiA/AmiB activator)